MNLIGTWTCRFKFFRNSTSSPRARDVSSRSLTKIDQHDQSSQLTPSSLEKSRVFRVATVSWWQAAQLAISRSRSEICWPRLRSRVGPPLGGSRACSPCRSSAPCGGQKARLLHLGYRILFFTRIRKQAAKGVTEPFLFLGPGKFLDATGNRPIAIRWQLAHAMPTAHYREARLVSGMED